MPRVIFKPHFDTLRFGSDEVITIFEGAVNITRTTVTGNSSQEVTMKRLHKNDTFGESALLVKDLSTKLPEAKRASVSSEIAAMFGAAQPQPARSKSPATTKPGKSE